MTENQITEFVAKIDHCGYEFSYGNWMPMYFRGPQNVDDLKETFKALGLTVEACHIDKEGLLNIELNYEYAGRNEKKTIEDLIQRHNRLKALNTLWHNGGVKITDAEKVYFAKVDAEYKAAIAAANARRSLQDVKQK